MKRNALIENLIANGLNEFRREEVARKNAQSLADYSAAAKWHALLMKARQHFIIELQDAIEIPEEVKASYYEPTLEKAYFTVNVEGCAPIWLKFELDINNEFKKAVFISPSIYFDDEEGVFGWFHSDKHHSQYSDRALITSRMDLALADAAKKFERMQQVREKYEAEKKQPNDLEYENVDVKPEAYEEVEMWHRLAKAMMKLASQ